MAPNQGFMDRIQALAANLIWSWNASVHAPFIAANPAVWKETRSPWRVFKETLGRPLEVSGDGRTIFHKLEEAEGALQELLTSETRPQPELEGQDGVIAYFCAEFGLHESFPIYSGGLGILAGDHMKTASDMNLPMVGVDCCTAVVT